MPDYEQRKKDGTEWCSEPFYSHNKGYKLRLLVNCKPNELSVHVQLLKGEFDEQLNWPFRGQVTVELLSQSRNPEHFVRIVNFTETTDNAVIGRVKHDEAGGYWGYSSFIPFARLNLAKKLLGSEPPQHLKNNCLRFRVSRVHSTPTAKSVDAEPAEFIMTSFEEHRRQGYWWFSAPFYTSRPGYKMCIGVLAEGGKATFPENVKLGANLMKGEYDDRLSWPFRGHVHIQVRNQLGDSNHIAEAVCFTQTSDPDCCARVQKPPGRNEIAVGGQVQPLVLKGVKAYMPNSFYTHYVKNNSIVLRVLKVEVPSLRIGNRDIIVPNFVKLKKDGDCFFSNPFYVFERGYKMRMSVWPDGRYHGKGTHVSIYFHLMRGEYDSYLRWPIRGRITLRIVNHDGPKDFRESIVINESNKSSRRVFNAEMSKDAVGYARCIPHSLLPTRKKVLYIKDGSLHIQILLFENL